MMTKDVSAEIEKALQLLTDSGKQPTVALVKSRLTSNVPMPAIIAAIKSWKGNKSVPKIEVTDTPLSADDKIAQLEEKIVALTKRIEMLEAKQ
ncbi:hypothetical protein MACH09_06680 [Vibrio sp. MACH09]|uniref:hypothetical protein n=1 Tax=unclassified Vibrio TaxID=2614977 RepID=UPI001493D376|nr:MULTISPECIES: hypothetical protein [unclassified Vibrio]NOI66590.1 hypothetical protein [Vibrio sp. 99-8-1]GLO60160.1 hypothetical protein MACH09_06680 [Vibrio sp. MACH09]